MPKLYLHTNGPLNMLNQALGVIERHGITVERRDYDVPGIKTTDAVHLVWGMRHRPPVYEALARLDHVYFAENGWFNQHTGFYIDKSGPNGMSSIRHSCPKVPITPEQKERVKTFIADLHKRVRLQPVTPSLAGGDYLFVPMQVERDSQLLFWANCPVAHPHRQKWWLEQVCTAFPRNRIIVRPHPRDTGTARIQRDNMIVRRHGNVRFRADRSSYDWVAGARAVLGINSTVLLEALTCYKPIIAVGSGVFTGNRVMLEANGDPRALHSLMNYRPDADQITRFLDVLISRQIPYALRDEDVGRYPVLVDLINKARPPGTSETFGIPRSSESLGETTVCDKAAT